MGMGSQSVTEADPDIFAKRRIRQRIVILLISQFISLLASSHEIYNALQKDPVLTIVRPSTASATAIETDFLSSGRQQIFQDVFRCQVNTTTVTIKKATSGNNDKTTATTADNFVAKNVSDIPGAYKLERKNNDGGDRSEPGGRLQNQNLMECCNDAIRSQLDLQLGRFLETKGQILGHLDTLKPKPVMAEGHQGGAEALHPAITVFALSATAMIVTITNYCAFINHPNPSVRKVALNLLLVVGFAIQVINCTTFHSGIKIQVEKTRDLCESNTDQGPNLNYRPRNLNEFVPNVINGSLPNKGQRSNSKLSPNYTEILAQCLKELSQYVQVKQEVNGNKGKKGDLGFGLGNGDLEHCPSFLLLYTLWSLIIFSTVLIPVVLVYSCKCRDRTFFRLIDDISFGRKGSLVSRQRGMIQQLKYELETELDFDRRTLDGLQESLLEEYEMLKIFEMNYNLEAQRNSESNGNDNDKDPNHNYDEKQELVELRGNLGNENQNDGSTNTNTRNSNTNNAIIEMLDGQYQDDPSTILDKEFESYVSKLTDYNHQLSAYMNKTEAFTEIRRLDLSILSEYARYVNLSKLKEQQEGRLNNSVNSSQYQTNFNNNDSENDNGIM